MAEYLPEIVRSGFHTKDETILDDCHGLIACVLEVLGRAPGCTGPEKIDVVKKQCEDMFERLEQEIYGDLTEEDKWDIKQARYQSDDDLPF